MPRIKITRDRINDPGDEQFGAKGKAWVTPDFPGEKAEGVERHTFSLKDDDGITYFEGIYWEEDDWEGTDPLIFLSSWGEGWGCTEVYQDGTLAIG